MKEEEEDRSICVVRSLNRFRLMPHSWRIRWNAGCWIFSSWRATSMDHYASSRTPEATMS